MVDLAFMVDFACMVDSAPTVESVTCALVDLAIMVYYLPPWLILPS